MAYSVWNIDLEAIEGLVTSLSAEPDIIQCSISAIGYGTMYEIIKSTDSESEPIVTVQDITFTTNNMGIQKIGEVRIVLTRDLLEKAIAETHRKIGGLLVIILFIIYVVTNILLRHIIISPVKKLETMVDLISLGDFNARCSVETLDELGRLAMRVNTMADRLEKSDGQLRESETRLQLVLEGSRLGYWDWNIETGEVIRNSRWAEMLGYTLEEVDLTVNQWRDLHHPEDRDGVWKSITDHLEGRTLSHNMEYRMRTKDGPYRWILDQAQIVRRDSQGKALRMCGTHTDITQRKKAEQEKEKLQKELAQSQKMESIGQLAGGIAHDFNNMLGVILGYVELAMEEVETSGEIYDDLQEIFKAAIRSSEITKQLLAFARKQTVEPKVLDINECITNLLKMLRRLIGENITLTWIPAELPGNIKIDPSQLDQILANLCVNGRDAIIGIGNIIVKTGYATFDRNFCDQNLGYLEGEFIKLSVSDDGSGMDQETQNKIFDPFFTTKGLGKGTGLGLSTIYGIVNQNKGFVTVDSELEQGTTFNIFFPIQNDKTEGNSDSSVTHENLKGAETILLVEDEPRVLKMVELMLNRLGYTVLAAAKPTEAIEIVETTKQKISLVITDVIMSEMNGRELSDKLSSLNRHLKILFMSGYTGDIIAKNGVLDDGISYIHKPFSIKDLSNKVRKILDSN
jgi:two-component system, cell cycle sensor histidine kinase and response regulator CckA